MCSNSYYGIKDAEFSYGFKEPQWLTPYEAINQLNLHHLSSDLIYPNEPVFNNSKIVDLILLAKYQNKYGNLKLKSVLLSQLLLLSSTSTCARLHILSLPKDSYYWCKVENSLIPKFSLRAGYDQLAKQFSYIGRMKVSSLVNHISVNNTTNLVGSLTHIYEYIPAIVLQLHDLSFLDDNLVNLSYQNSTIPDNHNSNRQTESFWSRLRLAVKNKNSKDMDFNFISTNYEVLCLKKQPASLKQACILKLNKIDDEFMSNENGCRKKYLDLFKSINNLPNSIRNLLWPCYLLPEQCIVKNGRMRSSDGQYEIYLSPQGSIKFSKLHNNRHEHLSAFREVTTFEKNVESLLMSQSGVFLIYDNNQPMRKPTVLYKKYFSSNDPSTDNYESIKSHILLELSDNGYLRIIFSTVSNRKTIIPILNLNEFFKPSRSPQMNMISTNLTSQDKKPADKSLKLSAKSSIDLDNIKQKFFINVRLALNDILNLTNLPIKLIKYIMPIVYSLFYNIANRFRHAQHI